MRLTPPFSCCRHQHAVDAGVWGYGAGPLQQQRETERTAHWHVQGYRAMRWYSRYLEVLGDGAILMMGIFAAA